MLAHFSSTFPPHPTMAPAQPPQNLRILQWNCRSFRQRRSQLRSLYNDYDLILPAKLGLALPTLPLSKALLLFVMTHLGHYLFSLFTDNNLLVINRGSLTYINPRNRDNSACIDLAFVSPHLNSIYSWSIFEDIFLSDYYPISIFLGIPIPLFPSAPTVLTITAFPKAYCPSDNP